MFDIHAAIYDEDAGETDERRAEEYIDGLMEAFAESPEAQPVIERYGSLRWAACMMRYGITYLGAHVPEMSPAEFREIAFEIFPEKVSTEAEAAAAIIAELKAFWSFVHRQYGLENAAKILASVPGNAERRLQQALSDSANFGITSAWRSRFSWRARGPAVT